MSNDPEKMNPSGAESAGSGGDPARNPLAAAPLTGLIARFAIPSIIGMLVNAAYNLTDQIFIGNVVGVLGNAATTVAFPFVQIVLAFAQMSGVGTAANFNISLGAGEEDEAKRYLGSGLMLTAVFAALLFAVTALFRPNIIRLFGSTDKVFPYAMTYLGITMFGLPLQVFSNFSNVVIRADRSPSYSMFCLVSGALTNIALDALFMLAFDLGIAGAAWATVISQALSFTLSLRYYFHFRSFRIERAYLKLRRAYASRILKLGAANFFNHIIMALSIIVLNNTLKYYGAASIYGPDIPLAVSGIISKVSTILTALVIGTAQGCQPIWSFNLGAGNYRRVKDTYRHALRLGLMFSTAGFLLFQFFPRQIASLFGTGSELYFEFAEQYLRVFMMLVFLFATQPITVNYFTSIGNVRQGILLSISRQGFILLPLLLILPHFFGLDGVLAAGPISDGLAAALALAFVRRSFRQLDGQDRAKQLERPSETEK